MKEQMYMNEKTGSVDTRDGWDYENSDGLTVNAVDSGEVVPVIKVNGEWIEGEETKRGTRKGVIIDQFGRIMATIDTREKAGMHTFSNECISNECGGFTAVNSFVARLSFSKKLLEKASRVLGIYESEIHVYHIYIRMCDLFI